MRRILSVIVGLFGSFSLLTGLINGFGSSDIIQHSIENSRSIEASFKEAVSFVEQFRKNNSRLPSEEELTSWASSYPDRPYTPHGMLIETANYPEEVLAKFGSPTEGSYLLSYWRGEWTEYYSSWAQRSTLAFEKSDYYAFGSPLADGGIFLTLSALLFFGAIKLWKRPNPAFNTDAP